MTGQQTDQGVLATVDELSQYSEHYNANLPQENPVRLQPQRQKRQERQETLYDKARTEAENPTPKPRGRNSRSSMDVDQQNQYGNPADMGQGMPLALNAEQIKTMIYVTKNDNDEDIMCDSCLDDFHDEQTNDDLVICEKCNVAVHQSCYGHNLIGNFPQADWFCERCIELCR